MIAITGATGHLGRLVIDELLKTMPATDIVALARSPEKATDIAAKGVQVRRADYTDVASLDTALAGVDKLLLISSSEVGKRFAQHQAVIDAAKRAKVSLVAYTSILHADTSPLGLADEHLKTEAALRESGLPHALLRNGWYSENYTQGLPAAIERGALAGSAGNGRISSAARADYAAAAAAVLVAPDQTGKVYELAGDDSYTLADLAAEASRQSGKPVVYHDMPKAAYKDVLLGVGLPDFVAELLSDSDAGASEGGLYDGGHQMSKLIGRPTTPMADAVAAALR